MSFLVHFWTYLVRYLELMVDSDHFCYCVDGILSQEKYKLMHWYAKWGEAILMVFYTRKFRNHGTRSKEIH